MSHPLPGTSRPTKTARAGVGASPAVAVAGRRVRASSIRRGRSRCRTARSARPDRRSTKAAASFDTASTRVERRSADARGSGRPSGSRIRSAGRTRARSRIRARCGWRESPRVGPARPPIQVSGKNRVCVETAVTPVRAQRGRQPSRRPERRERDDVGDRAPAGEPVHPTPSSIADARLVRECEDGDAVAEAHEVGGERADMLLDAADPRRIVVHDEGDVLGQRFSLRSSSGVCGVTAARRCESA